MGANNKKYWLDANANTKGSITYKCTPSMMARNAFFYLQTAGHFHCSSDYYTRREGYRSYLLIYTVQGKGYALYHNRKYELGKGQVLLMDCYDYQEYRSDPDELWEIKWIHFCGSTSREYCNTIFEKYGPVINLIDSSPLPVYLDEIIKLAGSGDIQLEIKVSRLIMDILTELLLTVTQQSEKSNSEMAEGSFQAVLDLVEGCYDRGITLQDMAAAACSSIYHFSRTFKKVTGYSPYEYLVKYRITKAKKMLESSGMTVEEISYRVGFGSTSNFIRTFKSIEGMTPLKYRKYWLD